MKRQAGLLLACAVLANGCASSWHTVQASPAAAMSAHGAGDIRVTRRDGSRVVLEDPFVSADSIIGYEPPPWNEEEKAVRRAIALNDVKSISVWERDKTANTVLWVIGASFGALFILGVTAIPNGGIGGT